jgi:hypothetical protein
LQTQQSMTVRRYSPEFPPPHLVTEIRKRLEGVCAGWPAALFETMTARAAWIEFKYDRAMTDSFKARSIGGTVDFGAAPKDEAPRNP